MNLNEQVIAPEMLVPDAFVWSAPDWLPIVGALAAIASVLVIVGYARRRGSVPIRIAAATMKLLAIALLLACVLQPMRRANRPKTQANWFPILIDDSRSGTIRSADGSTLADTFRRRLDPTSAWQVRLRQDFAVRDFAFDGRLRGIDSVDELTFDGPASSIAASLRGTVDRYQGRPVAGILLWTDGNDSTAELSSLDASKFPFPIYPVVTDSFSPVGDVRIENVSLSESDFETAPLTIRADIATTDASPGSFRVMLMDGDANSVEESTVTASRDQSANVRFQFKPVRQGVQFYRLAVWRDGQSLSPADIVAGKFPDDADEAVWVNNVATVSVHRRGGPFRLLYVAGRPNWEYKFLRRSLQPDPETQLVGLLRIANREPKFSFRDNAVGDTNPLFAGLDADEMELREQMDEPVIIRLGVREAEELSDGFPKTAEELFTYDAVLIDDLETDFFSEDQLLLLRRFVADRGGGLMLMGGQESFSPDRFAASPLGELSPVYVDRVGGRGPIGPATLSYSREGVLQPWLRLRSTEAAERNRLQSTPKLTSINRVGPTKPGGSELIQLRNDEGQVVAGLVTQRFGKGRTAALMIGDLWRMHTRTPPGGQDDPGQLWRQMTRWLVSDVPRRIELSVEPTDDAEPSIELRVDVVDPQYRPLENASVRVRVTDATGRVIPLTSRPGDDAMGQTVATFTAAEAGGYQIDAVVDDVDGSEIGRADAGWVADPDRREFQTIGVNRVALAEIARQSGGRLVDADSLDAFVDELSSRPVPVMETWTYPLWHQPWVLAVALVLLCGEWGLRRYQGWA